MGYKRNSNTTPLIQINAISGIVKEIFTATEGQQLFNLQNNYTPNTGRIKVYVGSVPQYSPEHFTETSNNSITLSEGVSAGTEVIVEIFQ